MMNKLGKYLVGLVGGTALLGAALPASALVLPPIPKGAGDAFLYLSHPVILRSVLHENNNTRIRTTAPNGTGVVLYDFDHAGKEGGGTTQHNGDYIYAFNGFILFRSDTETKNPYINPGINPANFVRIRENGKWQRLDQIFGLPNAFYVFSDVPEPATWAIMLAGLGLVGASLRRRRARGVPVAALA